MTSGVPRDFSARNSFSLNNDKTTVPYIPAMHAHYGEILDLKNKKRCRTIQTVTSVINSFILTAGIAVAGFFGFKWLKSSN